MTINTKQRRRAKAVAREKMQFVSLRELLLRTKNAEEQSRLKTELVRSLVRLKARGLSARLP
jgi:hypothetical protein